MDRKYKGLTDYGVWQDFESDDIDEARPVISGYIKVIDVETGEELKDN